MSKSKPSLNDLVAAGIRHYAEQMCKREKEIEQQKKEWDASRKLQEKSEGYWVYYGLDHDTYWVPGSGYDSSE